MSKLKTYSYLFGSKMLKLDNPRDEDWLTFVDAPRGTPMERNQRRIEFSQLIIKTFIEGRNEPTDSYKALFLYQLSKGFQNCEDYPLNDFNILEHKTVWIEQLKNYMNLDATVEFATNRDYLPKKFYHILYQYNMIVEDVHFISDAAKVNVQKIHDLEMPSSYFYELRDLINSL